MDLNTHKYTLVPRGPVRGIADNTTITEKTEIELNDFQALKVLFQGHTLQIADSSEGNVGDPVLISDFVDGVDPQVIAENVNLVPDVTEGGSKRCVAAYSKVFGLPRDFKPGLIEVTEAPSISEGETIVAPTPEPSKPTGGSGTSSGEGSGSGAQEPNPPTEEGE